MRSTNRNRNCIWKTLIVFSMFLTLVFTMNNIFATDNVAQLYDSTYNQDGGGGIISMNMDSEVIVQSNFSHDTVTNNQRLYVNETGTYKVSYSCVWHGKAGGADGGSRRIYQNNIRINGSIDVVPSESDVYIRGDDTGAQAGGHISSTSATMLVNLTDGGYIELRGGIDSGNTAQTDTERECFLTAQRVNTRAIEVYDGVGGQSLSAAGQFVTVNLDNTYYNGDQSLYQLNNDQVNVSEDGWYKVSYTSCVDQSSGSRISPQSWLRKNGNENISLSFSYAGYTRGGTAGRDKNCNRANTLVELNTSDYLEVQTGIFDLETATISTLINQTWLLIEKVELDSSIISINNSGQQIDHGVPTAIAFDQNDKLGEYISHSGSSSQINFNKSGLYELAYNIGYQDGASGDRVITCGYLKKNGNANITPSRQCVYTRGDAQARTGTVSTTTLINVSKNDYLEIFLDVEGEVGTDELVQIQKGTTWFTIVKINETPRTRWNNTPLDMGDGNLTGGNLTLGTNINFEGEGNTNVRTTCMTGDCSVIGDNFADGSNIGATTETTAVTFHCDDSTVGSYSADFKVNSTDDGAGQTLTITCDINQTYGQLSVDLINPPEGSFSNILQNQTLAFNATIFCSGLSGSICGNVTSYALTNLSTGVENISTTVGAIPMWTTNIQPQSCVLNQGENCSMEWNVNMTGTLGSTHNLTINASGNYSGVASNVSENTTINITVLQPNTVIWSSVNLNLGAGNLNLGDVTGDVTLIPNGAHTGVNTTCISGDCATIGNNWSQDSTIADGVAEGVRFTCDDGTVGSYSAVFNVNSSQDNTGADITVSCSIDQTYGTLNVTMTTPSEGSLLTVLQYSQYAQIATIRCEGTVGATCGNVTSNARYGEKELDYGDGADGTVTVTSANTILNNYTYLTGQENAGNLSIVVNDATDFEIGDEILIIQMQDGTGAGTAGNYEFREIAGKSVNTLTLDTNLTQTYGSGTFNALSSSATQVVRVPNFVNLTINPGATLTAPAWDGLSGGIIVFRATETLNTTGYINVSEKGFRGGDCNGCGNGAWGDQGEGTQGLGTTSTGSNANGGGGGFASDGNGGEAGGGGGYGTAGGDSTGAFTSGGGGTEGQVTLTQMFFGGGAGAGGDNSAATPFPENVDGGGISYSFAKEIINARVYSQGQTAIVGVGGGDFAVSGSGAGGTIWLGGNSVDIIDVNASGGPAIAGNGADVGGAGGDGRIRLDYLQLNGSTNPTHGYNSSAFPETMTVIRDNTGTIPFYTTSMVTQECGVLNQGSSCPVSWSVNATGFNNVTYTVDVNTTSNITETPDNESRNASIKVAVPENITVTLYPVNNTKILSGFGIMATLNSSNNLDYAGIYVNGIVANTVDMDTLNNLDFNGTVNVNELIYGLNNITFLYNFSDVQYSNISHFYYLKNSNASVEKSIISTSPNIYFVETVVKNNLGDDYNSTYIDLEDVDFFFGAPEPTQSFRNDTLSGGSYEFVGEMYGWFIDLGFNSNRATNYSIAAVGNYNVIDNYMVGLE